MDKQARNESAKPYVARHSKRSSKEIFLKILLVLIGVCLGLSLCGVVHLYQTHLDDEESAHKDKWYSQHCDSFSVNGDYRVCRQFSLTEPQPQTSSAPTPESSTDAPTPIPTVEPSQAPDFTFTTRPQVPLVPRGGEDAPGA